jgi:hypothetical protein
MLRRLIPCLYLCINLVSDFVLDLEAWPINWSRKFQEKKIIGHVWRPVRPCQYGQEGPLTLVFGHLLCS